MKNLILLLLMVIVSVSCTKQVTQANQIITIYTIKDGAFDDPSVWNLQAVPDVYDVCDVNNEITISEIHQISGLKSTKGGKITCLGQGKLTIKPIK